MESFHNPHLMISFRILHVTDFHFGCIPTPYENSVSHKDNGFPNKLLSQLNTPWTHEFIQAVLCWERNANAKIDYIVCTGDFGEKGDTAHMETGVDYLIEIADNIAVDKECIFVCPGNHDLQREKEGEEFDEFSNILRSKGITNFSSYDEVFKSLIKGIPIVSMNSCIGGTAVSQHSKLYKAIIEGVSDPDKGEITKILTDKRQEFLNDFLDIPAIGAKQLEDLLEYSGKSVSDTVIILMHHNPVPNNFIEIRPYSNLVDSGKVITRLIQSNKKAFVLHGHTHFDYDILSYFPNGNGNYVSSIGCGALNNTQSSRANIYEFYFTDNQEHIISRLHRVMKFGGAGYDLKHSHSIYEKGIEENEDKFIKSLFDMPKSFSYGQLKEGVADIDDTDILRFTLKHENRFLFIDKKGSDAVKDWVLTRNYA